MATSGWLLPDFEQVKKNSIHFAGFNQVKKFVVFLLTLSKLVIKKSY